METHYSSQHLLQDFGTCSLNALQTVGMEQKRFVEGKFILDTLSFPCESMESATGTGQDSLFLKIDFDKAYDRVDNSIDPLLWR